MPKKINWVVVVAAALAIAGVAWFLWPRPADKPKITTGKVDRGDVVVRVTATGTLSALVTVQVGSQVSGRINEILVDFNSPVKKGAVIARLDRQLLEAAVTEARANHAAAAAAVERARVKAADSVRQRDRARELAHKNLIAQSDLDAAELAAKVGDADVGSAAAQLQQANSALDRANINVSYATIYAPIDGVVISRAVDVGQTVAASLQAPTLFTIAQDLRQMQVDTSVGEADIGKVSAGMDATFTVDAWPGQKFTGRVRQIRNAPQTVQNVVSYDVIIDVDNAELKLRPGMTANAQFVVATKSDVLRVPNAALRFKPTKSMRPAGDGANAARDGGPAAKDGDGAKREGRAKGDGARELWVMRGDRPVPVTIKLGITDGTVTEVAEGDVKEGDDVVTEAVEANASSGAPGGGPMPRRMF